MQNIAIEAALPAAFLGLVVLFSFTFWLRRKRESLALEHISAARIKGQKPRWTDFEGIALIVRILVSVVVLGAALLVILSGSYSDDSQKWAYGVCGTILGYWLKP